MDVTATSTTTGSQAVRTDTASATTPDVSEQFTQFLKLLTAQVQNQDPLTPLDSTQFVQQLATFSGLEQQVQTNAVLGEILSVLREG
jgi:flagellar basal-body rod modification protein FlgD